MQRYQNWASLIDSFTRVPFAVVTIYMAGTTIIAPIFQDNVGTPQTNPFSADVDGFFSFYGPNGRYDVELSGATIPTPFVYAGDVLLADP